jgi:hemin uptake protein HemP
MKLQPQEPRDITRPFTEPEIMDKSPTRVKQAAEAAAENAQSSRGGESDQARAGYLTSDTIFNGLREVVISHNGVQYRLRITSSDKLILTK